MKLEHYYQCEPFGDDATISCEIDSNPFCVEIRYPHYPEGSTIPEDREKADFTMDIDEAREVHKFLGAALKVRDGD